MAKKEDKTSRITEFIILVLVIICLVLIITHLRGNLSEFVALTDYKYPVPTGLIANLTNKEVVQ